MIRRVPSTLAFTFLGITGQNRFVDADVPACTQQVEYTVQGQRGKRAVTLSQLLLVTIGQGDVIR